MIARAYLLLNIKDGRVEEAVKALQKNKGVVRIDVLEGSPDVIAIIEASGQKKLTELTLRAFAPIKELASEVRLLPAKEKYAVATYSEYTRLEKTEDTGKKV